MALELLLHKLPQIAIDKSGESSRLLRSGLFSGVLLVIVFLIWGVLAPIEGAVVTSGIIKIDSNTKTIQHLEGGIIKAILVEEGSRVKKGQPLLILQDIFTRSQVDILKGRYYANKAREARLQAQKKNADHITFPEELANSQDPKLIKLLANETDLFKSKRKNFIDQVKLLKFEITQTELGLEGAQQEMEAIKEGIGFIKQQLKASQILQKKGYMEDSKIWELQHLLANKKERIGSLLAQNAVAHTKITETKLKIITLRNNYRQEAADQLKDVQKELLEIQELLRPAKNAFERTEVVAPLDGQVMNIKVNTIGGVVRPGEELMDLVPDKKELIIEVKINPRDIDNVHIEQLTYIQLLAYSARKTPMLKGKVSYVSEDVIEDKINRGGYYYLCHIKVDADSLANLGSNIVLFPGMPITAFLHTSARTFIDFILDPMISHSRLALREE